MTEDQTTVVEQTDEQKVEAQEAEDGFAAGFAKVAGEPADADAAATGKPAADVEAQANAEADAKAAEEARVAEAKAADEAAYNALPQSLRAQLDKLNSLPGAVDKLAGHLGGLKRDLATALATAKAAATEAGAETPTDKQVQAALSNPEAWKQLKEDFPDWAGPVEAEFTALRAEIAKQKPAVDVDAIKKDVAGTVNTLVSQGVDEAEERAFLRLKHPGWKQTVKTKEFTDWFKAQSAEIQALGDSKLADDAIKVFDSYTEHQKKVQDAAAARQRNQRRLESAVTPRGTSHPVSTGISDEEAFARGFKRARGASPS